jgi:hypothetical protein
MKGKIFNAQEVQAMLNKSKTMFRQVIKPQPNKIDVWEKPTRFVAITEEKSYPLSCPHQIGDLVFVKESFIKFQPVYYATLPSGASFSEIFDGVVAYFADGYGTVAEFKKHYMACHNIDELARSNGLEAIETDGNKWKPAQHMKQEHSRITLQIKEIRAERLQDISVEDAISDGQVFKSENYWHSTLHPTKGTYQCWTTAKEAFSKLWNATHKKPEEKWEANPWVWVINFEVIK